MKLEPKVPDEEIEVDMSPMIDMVFLLLIFFLVASNIVDTKKSVDVPEAVHAKVSPNQTGRILITIDADENLYVANETEVPSTIEEVGEFVKSHIDADAKTRVIIRADGMVKYEVSERVMKMCGEMGAQDMIIAAYEQL